MVVSLKANRKRILAVVVLIVVVVGGFLVIPKMVTSPMKHYGETAEQRISFLTSFGYDVAAEPIDARKVTIPREFNEVYTKYNEMQQAQGFDLKPYKGRECTQYIYLINNYPNSTKEIHATLLVYEGVIIGGDVSCAEVDGFMHGFALDSARYGESASGRSESSEQTQVSEEPSSQAEPEGESAQIEESSQGVESSQVDESGEASQQEVSQTEAGAEQTEAVLEEVEADIYPTD